MNPSGQVSEAKEKTPASEMVEVVVETEAEAGASGYSVTGGGKKGIFVKEVLRDSPAEKHLSLQKGDQLLSAKVYFDNVKYEDALKILQCAEPYKVSFLLKRTVPGTDVSMHPRANVDLKGPRAKMPKMSVRSKKPFKAKKMRAGRFGLKRLKENSQTRARREMEMEMEMSPVKVDFRPVDVEFVFPKFRKSATVRKEPVEGGYGSSGGTITAERKKRKIRFPKMKVKQTVIGDVSKDVDTIGAKVKVKEKAPIFGMAFTKTKNTKADSLEACKELKSRDIKFRPPSVEFDFSMLSSQSDADLIKPQVKDKDMLKFKAPEVQLSLRSPSGKAEDSSALATRKKGKKGPKASIKEGVKAENGESLKIEIPKIGFGSVDKTELGKDKNGKTKKATLHLSVPELIQHSLGKKKREKTSGPEGMFGIHVPSIDKFGALRDDVEASLPKLALITPKESLKEKGKELDLGLSSIEISLPKTKCEPKLGVQGREPDGAFQIRAIKLPVVDISLQKPDTDTHLPKPKKIAEKEAKEKLSRGSQDRIDGLEFKMPKIPLLSDNQDSKVESTKDADGKLTMPQVGISLPGIKTEDVDKRVKETSKFKMPTLTKMKVSKKETDIECAEMKGVKLKLPKLNIAIPKHASQDIETEAEGITSKFKLPEFDFSLPNIKGTDVSTSETKEGKGHVPQIDISLPKVTSPAAKVNVKEHSDKLQMPKLEILLPTTKLPEEKTTAEYGGIKSIALNLPKIDLSLPKRKSQEIDAKVEQGSKLHIPEVEVLLQKQKPPQEKTSESPKLKDFRIPTLDVSAPKIKSEAEVAAASPRSKESKRHISHIDILLPIKKTLDTKVNVKDFKGKGGTLTLPRCDISLPKIHSQDSDTEADITLSKGLKRNMPSLNISLPNLTLSEESILVSRGKKDVTNSRAAPVKIPAVNIEIPKFDINLNLPIRKKDVPTEEKVIKMEWFAVKGKGPESPKPSSHGIKFGKGNLPDISLSTSKGKTEVGRYKVAPHIEPSKAKHDLKVDTNEKIGLNLPTLKMPKLNIVTPKLPDIDLNLKMPKGTNETSTDQTAADHRPEWSENVPGIAIKIPKMFISDKEKGTEMKSPEADSEIPAFGSLKRAIKLNLESVFSKEKVDGREETNILKTSGRPHSDGVFLEIPKLSLPKLGDKFKSEDTEEQRAKRGTLMKVPFIEKGEMVKAKKGKFDIAKTENAEESDDDQMKYKLKIPKLSMPKLGSKDTDTGGSHVDPEHKIKVKMPSIEISLPAAKVPEGERLLPKAEAEVSEADIKRHEGNVKIPTVCISAPKISLGVSIPKDKHGVSTESGVRKEDESDQGFQGIASKLGIPKVTLPSFNVSSSKEENTERDLLMRGAKVNVLTHGSAADVSTDRQETKLKIPKIKKHQMDITEDLKNCKPEEEGKSSFTLPKFSVPDLELKVEKPKHGGEITVTDHSGNKTAGDPMKFEIPAIDLLFSKGDVKLDASLPKGEVMKGRKPKSGTLNLKTGEDAQQESSLGEKFQMPKIAFPGVDFSIPKERADKTVAKLDSPEISAKSSKLKIPDLEISGPKGAVAEANDTERGVGKLQMPKVKLSDTPSVSSDPETASDGPRMPNVKKAVFVLFNPKSQKSHSFTSHSEKMTSKEQTEAKVHLPKTRMKQSFEKSCSKEKDVPKNELENETHGNFMSRGSKLKMPKLSFTQGKTGSSDIGLTKPWLSESRKDSKRQYGITDEKHSTSQNESQEAKIRFGKLTLPKIAFYSPYSKSSLGKEDTENTNLVKKGKSIWG